MSHLLFVWKTSGYELREQDGDVPAVGTEVEQDGERCASRRSRRRRCRATSALCAYLVAA